jgi:hypothetical protein
LRGNGKQLSSSFNFSSSADFQFSNVDWESGPGIADFMENAKKGFKCRYA